MRSDRGRDSRFADASDQVYDATATIPIEDDYIAARVKAQLQTADLLKTRVGRFVVLDEIGSGGMGTVYAAYDERLDRKVAVKVMSEQEVPSEDVRLRFLREAQSLAKLSHPNVVTIHEVELTEDHLFIAMEFVRGQDLAAWLGEPRPVEDVLETFVRAGRGLLAAHEAGLVHRDFKPANVIRGDDGTVKVVDFGLARVVEPDLVSWNDSLSESTTASSSSPLTVPGSVAGTPAYMSPEQHRGEDVDARSDQYSFCVALWEGLVGERPFGRLDFKELARAKEQGPPSWPTTARAIPRSTVDALERGLAPDPRERWPSMQALLRELEPRPPTEDRRRWLPVLMGAGLLGLGALGLARTTDSGPRPCSDAAVHLTGIWDQARRTEVETALLGLDQAYAEDTWSRTERALDEYASQWVEMHTDACEATTIRGEQSPRMLDLRMDCLRRTAGELRATVDVLANADAEVARRAHELTSELPSLRRCADTEALGAGVERPSPDEVQAVDAARQQLARAKSLQHAGRPSAAMAAVVEASEELQGVEYGPVQTELALVRGTVASYLDQDDASEAALDDALGLAARYGQRDELRSATRTLIDTLGRLLRFDEAMRYRSLAIGLCSGQPREEAKMRVVLAAVLRQRGDTEAASDELRAALWALRQVAPMDPVLTANVREALGENLLAQDKNGEAETEFRASLSMKEEALGAAHPFVADSRTSLAQVLLQRGEPDEAESQMRAALSVFVPMDPRHTRVANARNLLAAALEMKGMQREAEAEYQASLEIAEQALGAEHPVISAISYNLARLLYRQGRLEESEAALRSALETEARTLGPDHPTVQSTRVLLGVTLAAQHRLEEAEAEFRRAIAGIEAANLPDNLPLASARANLASLLVERGRPEEALPLAMKAWDRERREDVAAEDRAEAAFALALALWNSTEHRDRARARRLAEDALRSFEEAGGHDPRTRSVERWLEAHPPK